MTLMKTGVYQSYWSDTASYYPVKECISLNFIGLKEDIIDLVNGNSLKGIDITRFNNENSVFSSKDSFIVYLIHLGYLAYNPLDIGHSSYTIFLTHRKFNKFSLVSEISDKSSDKFRNKT